MKCILCGKNARYTRGNGKCERCEDARSYDVVDAAIDIGIGLAIASLFDDTPSIVDTGLDIFDGGGGDFGGGGASGDW